mgnify:CR=1 FL=1
MSVVSVKTLHDGWTGSFTLKEMPTFTVVYLVEVDDPQDGNITVIDAAGIPRPGDPYQVGQDFHALSTCKSLSSAPVAGTRNLWQVTASFGKPEKEEDDDPTDGITEDGEPTEDPLKFAVSMSISSTRVTRDAIMGTYLGQLRERQGVAGALVPEGFVAGGAPPQAHLGVTHNQWKNPTITNGRAITNSVFRPFDPPPQVEYNRTNLRIKFNTLNSPKRIIPYINSVNSKSIFINVHYRWDDEHGQDRASTGQFWIPEFAGRIMGITTNPSSRNGIGYHENELEIEVDKLYTWRLDILDRGYATTNDDKSFSSNAGSGVPVTDSDVSEDGFANREPLLLDGRGQALNVEEMDAVYLRYGVYPEMDWHIVGLQEPRRLQGAN